MSKEAPRIWCDFNAGLENGAYSLSTRGSRESLARLAHGPSHGMSVILYTEDELEGGRPALLLANGGLEVDDAGRWQARVQKDTFRHEVSDAEPN